jgi:hypothetical protein
MLALAGVECDGCFPGQSLARHWTPDDAARGVAPASPAFAEVSRGIRIPDRYPNAKGDLKSLIAGNLHYVVTSDGAEELYDLVADPREERNLVGNADAAPALDGFRRQLGAIVKRPAAAGSAAERLPR